MLDNWSYAAQAKEIPLTVWAEDGYQVIGPEISSSTKELLDCVLPRRAVTAAKVAEALNISVANASTKLKKLKDQGSSSEPRRPPNLAELSTYIVLLVNLLKQLYKSRIKA